MDRVMKGISINYIRPGAKVGLWTVESIPAGITRKSDVGVRCECGTRRNVRAKVLCNRASYSCGCFQRSAVRRAKSKPFAPDNRYDVDAILDELPT